MCAYVCGCVCVCACACVCVCVCVCVCDSNPSANAQDSKHSRLYYTPSYRPHPSTHPHPYNPPQPPPTLRAPSRPSVLKISVNFSLSLSSYCTSCRNLASSKSGRAIDAATTLLRGLSRQFFSVQTPPVVEPRKTAWSVFLCVFFSDSLLQKHICVRACVYTHTHKPTYTRIS